MQTSPADRFRTAVESSDYAAAAPALAEYLAWFRTAPRTLEDTGAARDLVMWALQTTSAAKLRMAGEMQFLPATECSPGWQIEG